MWNCPNCQKRSFHLNKDWTKSICDKCGFEIDYEKIPILKDMVELAKQVARATTTPIDVKDMEEITDDNNL